MQTSINNPRFVLSDARAYAPIGHDIRVKLSPGIQRENIYLLTRQNDGGEGVTRDKVILTIVYWRITEI
ncbi:MAG: hypothetical protein ABSB22_00940 [Thermodesulfobacteriota bacterium]|jgi:hypothetical protein